MIEAIKQIGDVIRKKNSENDYQSLCEDPNANGKYKNILSIIFIVEGDKISYLEIDKAQYQSCKILKYCYRSGSANGPNCSPSAKITDPEKTFNVKILSWFSKVLKEYVTRLEPEELNWLQKIHEEIQIKRETIVDSLKKIVAETPKKEGPLFLNIRFDDNGEKKDLGDYPIFRKILQWESSMDDDVSISQNQTCSLCGQKTTVYGNISTYSFYTNDKPGFIIGGFREEDAWKNYPICSECAKSLEKGRNYIETHFLYRFTGLPFYLIPKVLSGDKDKLQDILNCLVDDHDKKIYKLSISDQSMRSITYSETYILEAIGGTKEQAYPIADFASFHLLFLKKSAAAERIVLHLEDVLPSRIGKILCCKDKIDTLFKNQRKSHFTFFDLRYFFSKSDPNNRENDLDKYFLEIIEKIFKGNPININWLLGFLMKKIREEFIKEDGKYFHATSIRALMNIQFLYKLKLIEMREEWMEKSKNNLDCVFEKYENTFTTPSKRGLFLLGTLTELLLRKQYADRNAKPFMKQLKGLKMNEKDFKGLLPKVQNKLEEYKSFDTGKRILAEEISNYLLSAGDTWNLTHDEMNFYFSAGMNLVKDVTILLYDEKQEDEILEEVESGVN